MMWDDLIMRWLLIVESPLDAALRASDKGYFLSYISKCCIYIYMAYKIAFWLDCEVHKNDKTFTKNFTKFGSDTK